MRRGLESLLLMIPYEKFHIKDYLKFKDGLISSLELDKHHAIDSEYERINRTDWDVSQDNVYDKRWSQIFFHYTFNQIKSFYHSMGYDSFYIDTIWFQEYQRGDFHNWHDHDGSDFSNIFFLHFNKLNPGTEFMVDDKVIQADVSEGDLIIFPGKVRHRAPVNDSDERRLVIVFNTKV